MISTRRRKADCPIGLFLVLAVLPLFLLPACSAPDNGGAAPDKTSDGMSYEQPPGMVTALKRGTEENRIVMVEIHIDACDTSDDMNKLMKRSQVRKEMEDLIHIQVGSEGASVIEHFGLSVVPTYIFFKPGGEHMPPVLEGYRTARTFVKEIQNFKLMAQGKPVKEIPPDKHPRYGKG